jgi:uncharacterized membrane-anchored protein
VLLILAAIGIFAFGTCLAAVSGAASGGDKLAGLLILAISGVVAGLMIYIALRGAKARGGDRAR